MYTQPQNQVKMTETTKHRRREELKVLKTWVYLGKKQMIAVHGHECIKCH